MTSEDPALIDRLEHVLRRRRVRLAVLFGSAASGKNRPDSDVDVAILDGDQDQVADFALSGELSLAAGADVDLVRLETASTLLKWQIAAKGLLIYESSPGEFTRFKARAAAEYIDFAPAFEHYGEIFRRRLIHEASSR